MQVLSDHSRTLCAGGSGFRRPNWEDPHLNIALPVFSIHGNHDEPGRDQMTTGIAALDLLALSGLVNYFGKVDALSPPVDLYPVLLRKGSTRVALYGIGAMQDVALNHLFHKEQVLFRRPVATAAAGGGAAPDATWFNVLTLHQNRNNRGRGLKNCIPESALPGFIDLVLWGHEHDSRPEPEPSVSQKGFRVCQPGSTVATSLSPGEALAKHAVLLTVQGTQFKTESLALRCVRPLVIADLALSEAPRSQLDPHAPDLAAQLRAYLMAQGSSLIKQAQSNLDALPEEMRPPPSMRKPLIRMRVEHTGFPTLGNQRFGADFTDDVANPDSMLLFYRKRVAASVRRHRQGAAQEDEGAALPFEPQSMQDIHDVIGELLTGTLKEDEQKAKGMSLLPPPVLQASLKKFVLVEEGAAAAAKSGVSSALKDAVADCLQDTRTDMYLMPEKSTDDLVEQAIIARMAAASSSAAPAGTAAPQERSKRAREGGQAAAAAAPVASRPKRPRRASQSKA